MPQDDCVFCKIVAGAIPSRKVYEDERVLVFLDIGPIARGHTLVIPKAHTGRLEEMDPEDGAAVGRVLPAVGRAVLTATGAADYNVLQNNGASAGQAVGHVHFHVIPRHTPGNVPPPGSDTPNPSGGEGLAFSWPAGELSDRDGAELSETMRGAMGGVRAEG